MNKTEIVKAVKKVAENIDENSKFCLVFIDEEESKMLTGGFGHLELIGILEFFKARAVQNSEETK